MAIDFSNLDFSWVSWPGFRIITMGYFAAFGILNIYYAVKSRNDPKKKDNPKLFINEIANGALWLLLMIIYPFLWNFTTPNVWIQDQLYFHLWDTFTVQIVGWPIHIFFARRNDKKHNRSISYDVWVEGQIKKYEAMDPTSLKSDIKRKLQHLLPGGVVIGFYYLAVAFEGTLQNVVGWDVITGTMYFTAAIGITFALLMNIFDLIRLMKWNWLGKFARGWANGALHPDELYTVTSACVMVLAFVPFFLIPEKQFLFAVCLIAGLSDASACIVGKKWGKHKNKRGNKTIEGYIAGVVVTYLLVLLVDQILSFGLPWYQLQILAILGAAAFFGVDHFGRYLSDNILNTLACGFVMYGAYLLMI